MSKYTLKISKEELEDAIEHAEWAIGSSRSRLLFGMDEKSAAFAREMRLRGALVTLKNILKKQTKES